MKAKADDTEPVPEWMYYTTELPFDPKTYERLKERIRLWADGRNPVEWACVLTGLVKEAKGQLYEVIDDFYELPVYDVCRRQNQLAILAEDILRIRDSKKWIVGLLHTHPSGDLSPSPFDIYLFMHLDLQLGRPLRYVIAGPKGEQDVYHFQKLWDTGAFEDLSKKVRSDIKKAKGGESSD